MYACMYVCMYVYLCVIIICVDTYIAKCIYNIANSRSARATLYLVTYFHWIFKVSKYGIEY